MRRLFSVLGAIVVALMPCLAAAQGAVLARGSDSLMNAGAQRVLEVAYERAGIPLEVRYLPRKRALAASSSGEVDGEVMRVASLGERFPTLKRVEPPIAYHVSAMYVRKGSGIDASALVNLGDYRVAVLQGVMAHVGYAEAAKSSASLPSLEQMFKMLESGRVDIVIHNTTDSVALLANRDFPSVDPNGIEFKTVELYHYLHEDRAELSDTVAQVLSEMADTGDLERAFENGVAQATAELY